MKQLITILTLFISTISFAQNVGIGTTTPDASALFDVNSTSKGILIPRMTLAQRTAIASPANGLMIYQTDGVTGFYYNRGSSTFVNWSIITEGKQYWSPSLSNNTDFFSSGTAKVGIGITNPTIKLHVTNTDSAIALLENSQTLANDVDAGLFFKTGPLLNSFYTGSIKTVGTANNAARMAFSTFAAANPNQLRENLSILDDGNVGIGTTTPGYLLDINGRARIRHNGVTSGLWYNKANNTEAALIGMVNDTTVGFFSATSPTGWKVGIDVKNGQLGIGTEDPSAPLTFPNLAGNKISFRGDATGSHFGIGSQNSLLQLYTNSFSSDIVLGYGSSSALNENVKFFGNGNIHIGKYSTWFNSSDNRKINFGNGDFTYIGEVGADDRLELQAGAFNFKNGDMFIGTTDLVKGAGYKLRVGGKIFSEEVRVQLQSAWPDYVFEKNYKKLSLDELEKYLNENKHLPNIPSAIDVEKDGQNLGDIQRRMLEKIEELSLYVIELKKEIDLLKEKK